MTGWIIAGSIILFLFLLTLISVKCVGSFHNGEFNLKAGFWFVLFQVYPGKPESEKKIKKAAKETVEVPGKKAKAKKKIDFSFIKLLIEASKKSVRMLFRHLVFYNLQLWITVGDEDAAECAISYGRLCSYVYGGLAASGNLLRLRTKKVELSCDFTRNDTQVDFDGSVKVRILFILAAGIGILFRFFVKTIKNARSKQISVAAETAAP